MGIIRANNNQIRLTLEGIAEIIAEDKLLPEGYQIVLGDSSMTIEVPYSFEAVANFSLDQSEENPDELKLTAVLDGDAELTREAEIGNYSSRDLAEGFVMPFIWDSFDLQHEGYVELVPLDGKTAEDYAGWLPDIFFEQEGNYAVGINVDEEAGFSPCGAVVYSLKLDIETGEKYLAVESIVIDPEYQDQGIATYVINLLRNSFEGDK